MTALNAADAIKLGAPSVSAVYLGSVKVWPVAAPSADPAFVKGNTSYSASAVLSTTVWFNDADHTAHATAGNLLVAHFYTISARYASSTPAGWTLQKNQKGSGAVALQVFTKISDGTETSVTFASSATYVKAAAITEWSSASIGTITSGVLTLPAATGWTGGPADAPVAAAAIPLFGYNYQNSRGGNTPTSPWVGMSTGGAAYCNCGYGYQPAPGSATSFAATSPIGNSGDGAWINVWIEPA